MLHGTNSFHEALHASDSTACWKPIGDHERPESAGRPTTPRRVQAPERNYSRSGRPLIWGGAPRALLDALVEPQLGLVTEGTAGTSRSNEPDLIRLGGRPNAVAG